MSERQLLSLFAVLFYCTFIVCMGLGDGPSLAPLVALIGAAIFHYKATKESTK